MYKKQKNNYSVINETVTVDVSTASHPLATMLIDLSDWTYLLELGIGRVSPNAQGYANCQLDGKCVKVHRLLLPESGMVDHENRDKLDNRRCNIREATATTNGQNKSMMKNNSSGFNGVVWNKGAGKWKASIGVGGKGVYLGYFKIKDDAIKARKKAEIEHGFHHNHGKAV